MAADPTGSANDAESADSSIGVDGVAGVVASMAADEAVRAGVAGDSIDSSSSAMAGSALLDASTGLWPTLADVARERRADLRTLDLGVFTALFFDRGVAAGMEEIGAGGDTEAGCGGDEEEAGAAAGGGVAALVAGCGWLVWFGVDAPIDCFEFVIGTDLNRVVNSGVASSELSRLTFAADAFDSSSPAPIMLNCNGASTSAVAPAGVTEPAEAEGVPTRRVARVTVPRRVLRGVAWKRLRDGVADGSDADGMDDGEERRAAAAAAAAADADRVCVADDGMAVSLTFRPVLGVAATPAAFFICLAAIDSRASAIVASSGVGGESSMVVRLEERVKRVVEGVGMEEEDEDEEDGGAGAGFDAVDAAEEPSTADTCPIILLVASDNAPTASSGVGGVSGVAAACRVGLFGVWMAVAAVSFLADEDRPRRGGERTGERAGDTRGEEEAKGERVIDTSTSAMSPCEPCASSVTDSIAIASSSILWFCSSSAIACFFASMLCRLIAAASFAGEMRATTGEGTAGRPPSELRTPDPPSERRVILPFVAFATVGERRFAREARFSSESNRSGLASCIGSSLAIAIDFRRLAAMACSNPLSSLLFVSIAFACFASLSICIAAIALAAESLAERREESSIRRSECRSTNEGRDVNEE